MTDLQLSLLALGALIIACVVLFNWWQERSMRKESAELFNSPTLNHSRDVLMDDFQIDTEALLKSSALQKSDRFEDSAPTATGPNATGRSEQQDYSEDEDEHYAPTASTHTTRFKPAAEVNTTRAEAYGEEAVIKEPVVKESLIKEYESIESRPTESRSIESRPIVSTAVKPSPVAAAVNTQASHPAYSELNAMSLPAGRDEPAQPNMLDPYATAADVTDTAAAGVGHNVDSDFDEGERYNGLPDGISHQIDLTAVLYLQQAASGAALREIVPALSGLDKPVYAHGLDTEYVWHFLTREQEAKQFIRAAYSMQLADRSGPVARDTLNQFQQSIDSIGHLLGAQIEWQGNPDPLGYALELDQFCIDVDKMVGFHIVQGPNGPFTGTKFRGLAEASGLVLGENGAFNYVNENGVLYSLVNQDNIAFTPDMLRTIVLRGISFQLDIPRVKNCAEVFNQMVLAAKQMEHSLNAALVDDHQRPLGEGQIEKIRQQLKVIHSQMVARGVVPGSPTALRLFS